MADETESTPKNKPRRTVAYVPADDPGTVAQLAAEKRSVQHTLKRVRGELEQLRRDLDASKAKVAELQPLADGSKANELAAELRTLKHRGRFDAIAGELGVRPGAIEDLYALSGYKPEADTVDDAAIRAAIEAQATARPYLFGEASAEATPPTPTPPTLPAGPGVNRGGSTTVPPARFTEDQLSDPIFVMQNWAANVQQAQDGIARGFSR